MMVPIRRAKMNGLVDSAPINSKAKSIKMMVRELFKERTMVSVMAWLMVDFSLVTRTVPVNLLSSRMRSKTTIVSWTENDKVVSTAVTNRRSTWRLKKWPSKEKLPRRISESCNVAIMAQTPNFSFLKVKEM